MSLLLGLAAGIGLLLGLLGGGGSILTVPLLVYLAALEPKAAMATSLVVVGITSLIAMVSHARRGRVCWKTGLVFATSGMVGSYGGGRMAAYIPGNILLLLFAAIMFATAVAMLRGRREQVAGDGRVRSLCPLRLPILPILFDGLAVGALTGLVGAGGGFMVVPALNLLGGLPIHAAAATSLLVIALQSFAAFAGYISHVSLDPQLTMLVTTATVSGSLVGGSLADRVSPPLLRRGFGMVVILIALYLLYRELTPAVALDVVDLIVTHREFLWGGLTVVLVGLLLRLRALLARAAGAAQDAHLSRRGRLR